MGVAGARVLPPLGTRFAPHPPARLARPNTPCTPASALRLPHPPAPERAGPCTTRPPPKGVLPLPPTPTPHPPTPRTKTQELLPSNPLLSRDAVALSSLRALTSLELYMDDATTTYYHRRPEGYAAPDPEDLLPEGLMPMLVLPGNRLREVEYAQRVWPAWCNMGKVRGRVCGAGCSVLIQLAACLRSPSTYLGCTWVHSQTGCAYMCSCAEKGGLGR